MTKKRIGNTPGPSGLGRLFSASRNLIKWIEAILRKDGKPVCLRCARTDKNVTKCPWQDWVLAMYSMVTARKGVSALQFSREIGVTHRGAWHMPHRLREACGIRTLCEKGRSLICSLALSCQFNGISVKT